MSSTPGKTPHVHLQGSPELDEALASLQALAETGNVPVDLFERFAKSPDVFTSELNPDPARGAGHFKATLKPGKAFVEFLLALRAGERNG